MKKWMGLGLLVVAAFGAGHYLSFKNTSAPTTDQGDKKILYWVAPMDPNYQRDEPGLSPMGMELIPVYEGGANTQPGVVEISPAIVNSLGVRTEFVEAKALSPSIRTVGYVQYDEDRLIHIHPRVEGWVEQLWVKASGDPVSKGQPLYSLYSPELVNAQNEFLLAINRSSSRLEQAARERLLALRVANEFIDQLKASGEVRQTITFYAAQDGVVDHLNIREGYYVQPGTTIMAIGSLDEVWVEAEIFERQSFLIKEGLPVTMSLDYLPGQVWDGKVDYVYPSLDVEKRTLRARLRFENQQRMLRPNMFAEVEIHTAPLPKTLVVPRDAVIQTGVQERVVLALPDGMFKSVAVIVGLTVDGLTQIKRGVNLGDKVVTSAHFLLDSESSKTSDFLRWHNGQQQPLVPSKILAQGKARVGGRVLSIDAESNTVTVARGAIEGWGREAAVVEFIVADSIAMANLKVGEYRYFEFLVDARGFTITQFIAPNQWPMIGGAGAFHSKSESAHD